MTSQHVMSRFDRHDCMSPPQHGVAAYSQSQVGYHVFGRVVSRCLLCGFRLPECPSATVGFP